MSVGPVSDYPSLFEAIRKRPALYVGGEGKDIELLAAFIGGIFFSETFQKLSTEKVLGNFDWKKFEEWTATKFNERRLALNSFGLAKFKSTSSSDAFDLWYSWYDQFQGIEDGAEP